MVGNNFTVDSRVLRQAQTFARAGHDTLVVAVRRWDVPAIETRDGFEVRRVHALYTWNDAYPRIAAILGPLLRPTARAPMPAPPLNNPTDPPGPVAAPAPRRPRLRASAWFRWIRTGDDPAPRSWERDRATTGRRLWFALTQPFRIAPRLPGKAFRVAKKQVRRVRRLSRRYLLLPTRYRQLDRRMAAEAIAFKPDLIWANDAQPLRAAAAAARATGARVVYDAHEVIWDAPTIKPLQRRLWGLVERTQVPKMDRVFTVCDPIADLTAKRYRVPRPTVVLNCPRLSETSAAPTPQRSPLNRYRKPGERLILFHGSLSPWRGLEQLITAMGLLPAEYRLVILGHGIFRDTLEQLAAEAHLTERITFLSSVPPDELPAWAVGADVGMIPYQLHGKNHEYSTPNKLFEYMHLGVPVVVNDLPQIRRIVTEVGFGIVCDCSDPATMAKAIVELLADPIRYEDMRVRARAAAERYSWEAQEPAILSALES